MKVMKKVKPSIVIMNETQLKGRMKAELPPYGCWSRNREEQGGGGVATAVDPALRQHAMGVGEGQGSDEFIITRVDKFKPAINVINCYGEQRKTKVEEVEAKWERLVKEMEAVRARGEFCLLAGDMNKLVGCDEAGVPGNHSEISPGGHLLRGLLATEDWVLVNGLGDEVVEGGPFTREDPATGKRSCLDLFLVSRELRPFVDKLIIDSNRKMAVSRVIKKGGSYKKVFSDHYSCLLTLSNLPSQPAGREVKQTRWNLAKDGGWEKYRELSDKFSDKLDQIIENEDTTVEEMMTNIEKIQDKIKYMAFGKVTIGGKKSNREEVECDAEEMEETAENTFKKQIDKAQEEIKQIEKENKCRAGRVWEIRKRVLGGTKVVSEVNAIEDPKTKRLVVTRSEVKNITLEYCKETLTQNKPEHEAKEVIEDNNRKVKDLLKETDGEFNADFETFKKNIIKFKKAGKRNYDFLTKAGEKFQHSMFKLCKRWFEKEEFPNDLKQTMLHMLYKGKGKREVLNNNRFIHCKGWLARAAEAMVVQDGLKPCLLAGSSRYQVGGQPGHRPEEHLFVMKSLVAKYRQEKRPIFLQSYDVSKFFDKERIEDGILACKNRGADPKAIRLWHKLNDDTQIKVKTSAGTTETANVGAVVGQGTIGGALISQAVLDDGVSAFFPPAGRLQLEYGAVPQAPLLWMDDILNAARGLDEAREANRRMSVLMMERGLCLNQEKTVCIVIGSNKQKKEATAEIKTNPLMCGNFEMKEKQLDKWLGQQVSARGLEDSVWKTVEAKEGKIKAAAMEIAAVVNDWRCRAAGGLDTAVMLWESCCVPSILHGAATWVEMSARTVRRLNKLQNWFLRLVLQVGPGTPLPALLWDSGMLDMELRVWREKVMLAHHLQGLGEDTLARQVWEEQVAQQWPGLAKEVDDICTQLGVESVTTTRLEVHQYRKVVTTACHRKNEENLRKASESIKKCERIASNNYGKQNYFSEKNLYSARKMFKTRFGMTDLAGNFKNNNKFKLSSHLCKCKLELETEHHILSGKCKVYGHLRQKYKHNDDESMMKLFCEVLQERDELETAGDAATYSYPRAGGAANITEIELATAAAEASLPGESQWGPDSLAGR